MAISERVLRPNEWLWCETWCSQADRHLRRDSWLQESKKYAKTIDLCQNPLTKDSDPIAS